MLLLTKNFGEIEIDESKILTFEEGIPGFSHCTRFILLHDEAEPEHEDEAGHSAELICYLQSLDEPAVMFVLMNVAAVMPDYSPLISEADVADLGPCDADVLVYNIAVVPDDITQLTVNLKAPLVIHTVTRKGKQVIVNNDEYGIRVHIFKAIKKMCS